MRLSPFQEAALTFILKAAPETCRIIALEGTSTAQGREAVRRIAKILTSKWTEKGIFG
jgi:hypothetical protein